MARIGSAPPPPADTLELRLAVFEHLDALIDEYGPSVPRAARETGEFYFEGRTLRLIEPRRAILKPAGWDTVLTVTTNLGVDDRGRYQDELDASGRLHHAFMRETQPSGAAYNRALIATLEVGLPLVLMVKVTSGYLAAIYPYLLDAYGERCCVCRINYRGSSMLHTSSRTRCSTVSLSSRTGWICAISTMPPTTGHCSASTPMGSCTSDATCSKARTAPPLVCSLDEP